MEPDADRAGSGATDPDVKMEVDSMDEDDDDGFEPIDIDDPHYNEKAQAHLAHMAVQLQKMKARNPTRKDYDPEGLKRFREGLAQLEVEVRACQVQTARVCESTKKEKETQWETEDEASVDEPKSWPLEDEEYERYSRQLVLPSVGMKGQLRLRSSSVLIVGAGGLGCPAAAYLAGAGVGSIGIVDGDIVDASNLHRQIGHATSRVGMAKVDSLITYLKDLNPLPNYNPHMTPLCSFNAVSIMTPYDLVLDCTDNPMSRYLISDVCVLLGKPLISASALRTDGQLMRLNCPPAPQASPFGGPCYRCIFPRPPPPDTVTSCGEGGILGPVVGAMGVLQALDAVKVLVAGPTLLQPPPEEDDNAPEEDDNAPEAGTAAAAVGAGEHEKTSLLLLSSLGFRTARMRGRRRDCFTCGVKSWLTPQRLMAGDVDYIHFCGGIAPQVDVLQPEERISALEYSKLGCEERGVLIDVREKVFFDMGSMEGAVNLPFSRIQASVKGKGKGDSERKPRWIRRALIDHEFPIYIVCRVGNDSQLLAKKLKDLGFDKKGTRFIGDIRGGVRAWKSEVDQTMPFV